MADTTIKIPASIIVRDFAVKLNLPITAVAAELLKNGIMTSMNEQIDFDTASIIAEDLGLHVELAETEEITTTGATTMEEYLQEDPKAKLIARAPVVVVLGHVDHGKTSLLDTIRKTNVTGGEAGGITQHVGAYQVVVNDRAITFIDTPGHEAFTQMRARGARVADVAVIVIAAEDGIKPQTEEVLRIVAEQKIPYIIAITKVDKPEANPERVKKELAEKNVLLEGWGGQVPVVEVSAKEKTGISELLESVLLVADVDSSKLMVNPNRDAIGSIIESHVDPKQGPIASVIVQTGTLKLGDDVIVGQVWGKVRSMKNDRGEMLKTAPPSTPVQLLGLKAAPQVGDILRVATDEVLAMKKKVKSHQLGWHAQTVVGQRQSVIHRHGEADEDDKPEVKKLLVILKTDTLGSAEAIQEQIKKIEHPEVGVDVVQRGLGIISEADVLRAEAAKATVYGFEVQVSPKADQLARSKNIAIKPYNVIYDLTDDIKEQLEKMLPTLTATREIGRLQVLAVFRNEHTFQVVGGKVIDGIMQHGAIVQVMRGDKEMARGTITQLQSNKQNTKEVPAGMECGLKVEGQAVIQVGDYLVAVVEEVIKRTLADRPTI